MADTPDRTWVESRLARWRDERDNEALGELLKWQRDRAYATALRLVRGPSDAEDVVQKAFLKLLSRTKGFEDLDAFRSAVYRSVVQCAFDSARAENARTRRENAMRLTRQAPHHSPESTVANDENVRALNDAMSDLDTEDRALVVLCCQEGLSASAASRAVGMPRETLRRRLGKCLSGLRERLGKRGVMLSLAGVVTLLQSGKAGAATTTLCAALDASLPGAACGTIAAATAAPTAVASVLATVGVAAKIKLGTAIATAVAAVAGTVGVSIAVAVVNGPAAVPPERAPIVVETPVRKAVTRSVPREAPAAPEAVAPVAGEAVAFAAAPAPKRTTLVEPELPTVELEDDEEEPVAASESEPKPVADEHPEPARERPPIRDERPDGIYALFGRARGIAYWVMVRSDGTILRTRDAREMPSPRSRPREPGRRPLRPLIRNGDRDVRPLRPREGRLVEDGDRERPDGPPPPPAGNAVPLDEVPDRVTAIAKRAVGGFVPERAFFRTSLEDPPRDGARGGLEDRPAPPERPERRRPEPRRLPERRLPTTRGR